MNADDAHYEAKVRADFSDNDWSEELREGMTQAALKGRQAALRACTDRIAIRLDANQARIDSTAAWLEAARIRGEHQDRILNRLKYVMVALSIIWICGLALCIWGMSQGGHL